MLLVRLSQPWPQIHPWIGSENPHSCPSTSSCHHTMFAVTLRRANLHADGCCRVWTDFLLTICLFLRQVAKPHSLKCVSCSTLSSLFVLEAQNAGPKGLPPLSKILDGCSAVESDLTLTMRSDPCLDLIWALISPDDWRVVQFLCCLGVRLLVICNG